MGFKPIFKIWLFGAVLPSKNDQNDKGADGGLKIIFFKNSFLSWFVSPNYCIKHLSTWSSLQSGSNSFQWERASTTYFTLESELRSWNDQFHLLENLPGWHLLWLVALHLQIWPRLGWNWIWADKSITCRSNSTRKSQLTLIVHSSRESGCTHSPLSPSHCLSNRGVHLHHHWSLIIYQPDPLMTLTMNC